MSADGLDRVFRALADPTRRRILDLLREAPRTTGELSAQFPRLSRFAVMKHLTALVAAHLVIARREGRTRVNALNVVPLQQAYERWMRPYEAAWASGLLALKRRAEGAAGTAPATTSAAPPAPRGSTVEPARSRARSPGTFPRPSSPTPKEPSS